MYIVVWAPGTLETLRDLPAGTRSAIGHAIYRLQMDPDDGDTKRLAGSPYFRLRVGDYRVIYAIDHGKVVITVIRIGHRRDVYR